MFILGIGRRACDYYKSVTSDNVYIFEFPYYQKLNFYKKINNTDKINFLFSGRLIKRNSIKEIIYAFEKLNLRYQNKFAFIISGYGPEEKHIINAIKRSPRLKEVIKFDRDFLNWNDRLRPFEEADILVVPATHSGWGLVIPEALAYGIPVISTPYVESARYYINEFINGFLIEPTEENLYRCFEFILNNQDIVTKMSIDSIESSKKGSVETGAKRISLIVKYLDNIMKK